MMPPIQRPRAEDARPAAALARVEHVLFETKRLIVGQDALLERLLLTLGGLLGLLWFGQLPQADDRGRVWIPVPARSAALALAGGY